jgi:hypothetical protein
MRIPGRGGAGGWVAIISEAAMPLSFRVVELLFILLSPLSFGSGVIVEVEVDLENALEMGLRCVSLSFFVNFQDILYVVVECYRLKDVWRVIRRW